MLFSVVVVYIYTDRFRWNFTMEIYYEKILKCAANDNLYVILKTFIEVLRLDVPKMVP